VQILHQGLKKMLMVLILLSIADFLPGDEKYADIAMDADFLPGLSIAEEDADGDFCTRV